MNKKFLPFVALITTALIWGASVPLLKVNLETIPPASLAFIRFLIAAFLAAAFSQMAGLKLKDFLHIGLFSIFGVTLHIGLLLIGLKQTSTIDASLIFSLGPIITSILAVIVIREKINFTHIFGIFLCFSGIFLYIFYPLIFGSIEYKTNLLGNSLVFISTICASIYIIGSKKLFEDYKPKQISAVTFLVGALTFAPFSVWEYSQNPSYLETISLFNIGSLIFLALITSFVAFSLYEWGLEKVEAHIDATISYLIPITSIVIATVFLKEKLEPIFVFSVTLVIIGVYLVTRFKPPMHKHFHRHHHKV